MKAVRFDLSIPGYILGKTLGKVFPDLLWNSASCTKLKDIPEPAASRKDWFKIKTRYGGICGSDLGTIDLKVSPYFTPFSSFPLTLGHENVGTIAELPDDLGGWQHGDRVVVEPLLWCGPRGISPYCKFCEQGEINRCERITEGDLSPGILTGGCRDTGGSWSAYFLAHKSQLYKIPPEISDENALMVEPFAVGLHAALTSFPTANEQVLIVGAGTIGLCTLAALRALNCQAEIIVLARYPFQAKAAERLGADKVILTGRGDGFATLAPHIDGKVFKPLIGKSVITGGADRVYECVGSDESIDNSIRFARSGGEVILVGVPGIARGIDWSAIFAQELTLKTSTIYNHAETYLGQKQRTFDLALQLLSTGNVDLGWLVTHRFSISDFHHAMKILHSRGKHNVIKAVFAF